MKKMIKKLKNQRGSALLLTLGILSLVLIMAMSFAFSARTTRQVAKVNADQVKARLLAESALERVLAAMKVNYDGVEYPPENATSFTFSGTTQKSLASTGADSYDLSENISYLPILANYTPTAPQYQTIQVGTVTIGRVAFLVLEEANKLDINQMLTLRMTNSTPLDNRPFVLFDTTSTAYSGLLQSLSDNFNNSTGDFLYDITATELTPTSVDETNTVRLGLNMQEIQIADDYRTSLPAGFPGFAGTKAPWFSYRHLWNVAWNSIAPPITDAFRYTFFSGEDIEAYWDETAGEAHHRFDISGAEWGGWEHTDLVAAQKIVTDVAAGVAPVITDFADLSGNATGIPYLQGLATKEQVAANMVDFCDEDNFATIPLGWDGVSEPAYCGNEKVAYVNELVVNVTGWRSDNADDSANDDYWLKITPYIEFINIFVSEVPVGRAKLNITGAFEYTTDGGSNWSTLSVPNLQFTFTKKDNTSWIFLTTSDSEITSISSFKVTVADATSVIFRFKMTKWTITTDDDDAANPQIYDIAYWEGTSGRDDLKSDDFDTLGYPYCVTWEVGDPRLNHKSASWAMRVCSAGQNEEFFPDLPGPTDVFPTYKKVNLNFAAALTAALASASPPDTEDYASTSMDFSSTSKTFSTAFIPNRPFRSLWELGAIHRGEPFRTLDIAGADSAILDQVKIGPLKRTRGKFNSNSRNDAALAKLFENIDVTRHYDQVAYDESDTDDNPYAILVSPSLTASPSFSRAAISSELVAEAQATATTKSVTLNDRQREALIGRTANLLTTRVDKYSVLVVGQALKDLAGAGITSTNWDDVKKTVINPTEYDGGYYSLLGTQRILAHIVRDAWRNEYKVVQMQLLED